MFNLQLTIQRLEEELSLYRNGTTAEDMFEVIKEKEADIATLATKLENKDEMIRKLAKSSGDVLNKYDALLIEKSRIENELAKFVERCTETENKVQAIISENVQRTQVYEQKCEDLKFRLSAAEDLNSVLKGSIAAKESAIVDLSQTVLKYEHELATNKANEELLATLRRTVSDKDATIQHLKESLEDSDRSVEKLQKRCADLLSDKASKISQLDAERSEMMGHVCKFKETMAQNTAQLQETLRRKELKNDEVRDVHCRTTSTDTRANVHFVAILPSL